MVEGVLFDSGGVLLGARGRRWWPIYGFEQAVLAHFPQTLTTAITWSRRPSTSGIVASRSSAPASSPTLQCRGSRRSMNSISIWSEHGVTIAKHAERGARP
jgi:hypothetical protein